MNAKFTQAILDEGLNPPAVLIPGTVQRVPGVDKDKDNKAGWILLFKDRQGGVFGDFSSGLKKYWHEAYETFSHEERKAFFKQCEEARNLVAAEREKEHQAAAEDTQKILGNAHGNPLTHSYAKRKGSQKGLNFGAGIKRGKWPQRGWDDALLAPMQDVDGTIWTLQAINVDGTKDFLKGGRKKGGFYPFGNINGAHRVLIGEGLATVAAVHAVDGAPAVAAMDAGSLPAVALAVRKLAPNAEIILLADNDIKPDGSNPGLETATKAAKAVGGRVAIPELNGKKCDFWDVWNELGVDAVKDQLGTSNSLNLFDDGDTLGANAKPANYLINGVIESNSHGILGWMSKSLKSFCAFRFAHSVSTERDFFGHKVFKAGPVLYVCGEGRGAVQRRIKAAQIHLGSFNGNLKIWNGDIAIDSPSSMRVLKNAIKQLKPVLVIFDTFSSLIGGEINENDNAQVARVLRLVKDTCQDCSSLVVHHFGKTESSGFRGASAFFSNIDFGFVMKRDGDSMLTELSCTKMKDGEPFAPITMAARVVELGFENQDGTAATSLVLEETNIQPTAKTGKAKKPPKGNDDVVLTALIEATDMYGISPSPEIRAK